MVRWWLTVWMSLVLCVPVMAQEADEGDEAAEPAEEAGDAGDAEEAGDAAEAAEAVGEEVDVSTLTWEKAWDSGFAMYREGRFDEAVPYLRRALDLEPDDPTVRAYLGECYRQVGDEAAATALREVEVEAEVEVVVEQTEVETDDEEAEHHEHGGGGGCGGDEKGACGSCCGGPRSGKHLALGLTLAGNALSLGMHVDVYPVPFLSVEAGIGLGDTHTYFWWGHVAAVPLNKTLSPSVGVGALGTIGLDFHYQAFLPGGDVDYYLNQVNPYVHLGVVVMSKMGFTGAFDLNLVITGDPNRPVFPWPGFRLGYVF